MYGYLGTFCFSLAPVIQAYCVYKIGHARGLSSFFLWLWVLGEIFYGLHTYVSFGVNVETLPFFINYLLNGAALGIIIKYKYWETDGKTI